MLTADVNPQFPNRIEFYLGTLPGPLVSPGPLGAFDPRRDLEVFVDGNLSTVNTFSFDASNNRYLLYMTTNIDIDGIIQLIHHMPQPPFESFLIGFGAAFGGSFAS